MTATLPPAEFLPVQHPKLVSAPPNGAEWIHEIKFDGYRMQLRVADGVATWRSRSGADWSSRLTDLSVIAGAMPDCVLDGELCLLDGRGQPDFSALRGAMGRRQTGLVLGHLIYYVFDALFAQGDDLRARPLRERKARLEALLAMAGTDAAERIRMVAPTDGGGPSLLAAACRMQLEGIVSKRLDSTYL